MSEHLSEMVFEPGSVGSFVVTHPNGIVHSGTRYEKGESFECGDVFAQTYFPDRVKRVGAAKKSQKDPKVDKMVKDGDTVTK